MTTEEMVAWIDEATYEELLRKWRFTPGSPFFRGCIGKHFQNVMAKKRDTDLHAAGIISRRVGFDRL